MLIALCRRPMGAREMPLLQVRKVILCCNISAFMCLVSLLLTLLFFLSKYGWNSLSALLGESIALVRLLVTYQSFAVSWMQEGLLEVARMN